MKYRELLKSAEKSALKSKKEPTAIKSLLLNSTTYSSSELYLRLDEEVSNEVLNKFNDYLDQYINKNRPVQYILGFAYFYGYKILVNEGCLIPRWETEELANNILIYYDEIFKGSDVKVLDLGTGSGAIGIALAKEESHMKVTCSDISEEAIKIAKESAKLNDANITFKTGSWFEPLKKEKFDIIVSNPPYLTTSEYVEDIVKDNEPDVALYGGVDGLDFYRLIISEAKEYLNDKFIMGFEHGYKSKDKLNMIIKEYFPSSEVINLKDSSGRDRMTFIINK